MLQKVMLIGLAGGAGAVARFGLASLVNRMIAPSLPWGTIVVNILGCLAFGFFTGIFEQRLSMDRQTEAFILTGFMGAFTTFSTYMFETHRLFDEGLYTIAIGNLILQNVVGLLAILAGLALGRLV